MAPLTSVSNQRLVQRQIRLESVVDIYCQTGDQRTFGTHVHPESEWIFSRCVLLWAKQTLWMWLLLGMTFNSHLRTSCVLQAGIREDAQRDTAEIIHTHKLDLDENYEPYITLKKSLFAIRFSVGVWISEMPVIFSQKHNEISCFRFKLHLPSFTQLFLCVY